MRQIDPKFHIYGDQIIKTSNGDPIPEDEPLMLLRARDKHAVRLIEYYHDLCYEDGCAEFHMEAIQNRIDAFTEFAEIHPDRMKQPGITRGV